MKRNLAFFLFLVFVGALLWAKTEDSFRRIWFTVNTGNNNPVKCVAVLPKVDYPRPVVIYLYGSGGNLMTTGDALRRFAELGLAAVGMEYDQSNQDEFDNQFLALIHFVRQQPWAMTNSVAWVGFSLGAQRTLSFALKHAEIHPQLLVRLSGGWVPEADLQAILSYPVLLIQGENDQTFPLEETRRLAKVLRARGTRVNEQIIAKHGHGFGAHSALVMRMVAEYCKSALKPNEASTGITERHKLPFWIWMAPAFGWGLFCFYRCWHKMDKPAQGELKARDKVLRFMAYILTVSALAETAVHVVIPHLSSSDKTLAIAREWLIAPAMLEDFDNVATNSVWHGKPLKYLLEHVELAHYNRNDLINWKIDDSIYRDFVLSPYIDGVSNIELNWRRTLWESFYPRIKKEESPALAAHKVVNFLRERVTIDPMLGYTPGIETVWKRGLADSKGFEMIYVAALRSVGIGARLDRYRQTEFWNGRDWTLAPRPGVPSFLGLSD